MNANLLIAVRKGHGWTQGELGAALGVPQQRVSEWERGAHRVPRWMRPELESRGFVVSALDSRLPREPEYRGVPAEIAREIAVLWTRRNTAPDDELHDIDAEILRLLLPHGRRLPKPPKE